MAKKKVLPENVKDFKSLVSYLVLEEDGKSEAKIGDGRQLISKLKKLLKAYPEVIKILLK